MLAQLLRGSGGMETGWWDGDGAAGWTRGTGQPSPAAAWREPTSVESSRVHCALCPTPERGCAR